MLNEAEVLRQIKEGEKRIELGNAVSRLLDNVDYKKVFTNHLFSERILEVVNELHLYNPNSPEHEDAISELRSISRTQSYLTKLIDKGQWAKEEVESAKSIPDSELE